MKEMIFAFTLVFLFQYINFLYLELFSLNQFVGLSDDQIRPILSSNISQYRTWNNLGILVSITMLIHVCQKIFFNMLSLQKLPFDNWTKIDLLTAALSLVAFMITGNITVDDILDKNTK